jgi:uncharacterized protein YndB with AHSA1/START domain
MRFARGVGREPVIDVTTDIAAPPPRVLEAFFDAASLARWWHVTRSVTTPRLLGPYAIEWLPTGVRDELLGRLGGVLRGTVMEVSAEEGFFVADLYWLPPDSEPIGPMALDVAFASAVASDRSPATTVRVRQQGFEDNERWRRCYDVFGPMWERALASLKARLEAKGG